MKIDLHHQLLTWRGEIARGGHLPLGKRVGMKLGSLVLGRPWLYELLGGLARRIVPHLPRACWSTIVGIPGDASANCRRFRPKVSASNTKIAMTSRDKILTAIRSCGLPAQALPTLAAELDYLS